MLSDEAFDLLDAIIGMGAIDAQFSVSPKELRSALDISSRSYFDENIRELLSAGVLAKLNPTSPTESIRYYAIPTRVADYAGVDEEAVWQDAGRIPSAKESSGGFVDLDSDSPEYILVRDGVLDIRERVRVINDLPNRDDVINSLIAAENLWSCSRLRIIQIKVGVLMAIEDAAVALASTAKAVAVALLVDAIKSLVKSKTGVDLDKI